MWFERAHYTRFDISRTCLSDNLCTTATAAYVNRISLCYLRGAPEGRGAMADKLVLVGVVPEIVVIGPAEQVVWLSDTANLKIEFDPNRCPFQSNVFQSPLGRQLQSGPPRPGINSGSYKYRLWMNDQPIGHGEVILREK